MNRFAQSAAALGADLIIGFDIQIHQVTARYWGGVWHKSSCGERRFSLWIVTRLGRFWPVNCPLRCKDQSLDIRRTEIHWEKR